MKWMLYSFSNSHILDERSKLKDKTRMLFMIIHSQILYGYIDLLKSLPKSFKTLITLHLQEIEISHTKMFCFVLWTLISFS